MIEERNAWLRAARGVNIDVLRKAGSGQATPLHDRKAPGQEETPESPAKPFDDHKGKAPFEDDLPAPPPKPDPTTVSHQDVTFEVPADTVDAFLERAAAHLGGKEAGDCAIEFGSSPEFKGGKCVRAGITVTTTITRPVWGGGRPPSDDHRAAIHKAVQFIRDHEGRHRQAAIDVATLAVKDAVGKKEKDASAIINKIGENNTNAQKALDGKEGKITSINGGTDIEVGPAN
jgi:hypothetical protein